MPVPATPIGELRRWWLDIRCGRCKRRVTMPIEDLIRRFDQHTRIGGIVVRLRCDAHRDGERCGGEPSKITLADVQFYGKSMRKVREVTVLGAG